MEGVEAFLRSTFPTSTPAFKHAFNPILDGVGKNRLFQGPYLRVGLPFRKGTERHDFFPRLRTKHAPHLHQEKAWQRLRTDKTLSTLVATGTGSGKTECFLYPILDHILNYPSKKGIKAIILYPMNALATDQARRFAEEIHSNTATKGKLRVGLYVGGHGSESESMTKDSVITTRQALRSDPPDILMTNYKMLDYLLIRHEDKGIWSENHSDTLKYLVVDELHTFDGAQGSDLACLIRRVKARLKTPKNHLCCIGTSATLGSDDGKGSMTDFAEDIFGETFDDPQISVITEDRISPAAHIGPARLEARWHEPPSPDEETKLESASYKSIQEFISSQCSLWFPDADEIAFDDPKDRFTLADQLRDHQFLRTILTILGAKTTTEELELLQAIKKRRPKWKETHLRLICHSFLSLCAYARDPLGENASTPFLQIRSEIWMRELARLVGTVSPQPEIKFSNDLPANPLNQHLPVLHCRECGVMGWGARQKTNSNQLLPELDKFYEAFFSYNPDPRLRLIFPSTVEKSSALLLPHVCGNCITLFDSKDGVCPECGTTSDSIEGDEGDSSSCTFPIDSWQRTKSRGTATIADLGCPYCDSSTGLTIVGSRSASLTSVSLSQIFGSPYNDDKKAMAFSDSVQDASHRAGFFGARTYPIATRTALQEVIDGEEGPISLEDLSKKHPKRWLDKMGSEDFVGTFIPQQYEWNLDFEALVRDGVMPDRSKLPDQIVTRLSWDVFREFGIQSRIGRTLEKSGSAACGLNPKLLEKAVASFASAARETAGYEKMTPEVGSHFLLALCERLRRSGGIHHPLLDGYIYKKGNHYLFNRYDELPSIPKIGRGRRPTFYATFAVKDTFERLVATGSSPSWTQLWLEKTLSLKDSTILIEAAMKSLVKHEILIEFEIEGKESDRVWGLNPKQLFIAKEASNLLCSTCGHMLTVPQAHADLWIGSPCLRHKCEGIHELAPNQETGFFGDLYRRGDLLRVRSKEHTGLLERDEREELEKSFMRDHSRSTDPRLLSCTPTLELGVDVGNLSTVLMCSVPPEQANYAQRVGRAGRHDGNSIALTVATNATHDLTYYEEPQKMIAGEVRMPAIFLNAPAVLERQLTAYCIDRWIESTEDASIPRSMEAIYVRMSGGGTGSGSFPESFFEYIESNLETLLDGFYHMFEEDELKPDTIKHLEVFIKGDSKTTGSLVYKLQTLLTEAHRNLEDLIDQRKKTNKALNRNKKKTPRDDALNKEESDLKAERQGLSQIIKQIKKKETLNFLTDEGVIPNYAFPEEGVVLRSVILKQPQKGSKDSKLIKQEYEHMRPAEAAITELAPGNSFYVQGRKLTVDRVSVNQDNYEEWHFCRSCSYMAPVSAETEKRNNCPHCSCSGWRDNSLKQSMLKMRQVFVTAWDKNVRSGDQKENRDLTTFNRQTSITYDRDAIKKAYSLETDDVGFSFEFLNEVALREVNFGQEQFDRDPVEIGGKSMRGVGFKVCSECGKIWNSGRSGSKHLHDISCKHFGSDDEADFNQSLLLYRNLNSEAIRMMVPSLSLDVGMDAQSFIAALHLGLRKKFGGHLSHLKLGIQYQPVPGMDVSSQHVFLYDSVPGGTGYLKELTRNADSLLEVLEIALKELTDCSCQHDAERDGCYQCIKAYRFRFVDSQISRITAIEQLSKILGSRSKIEEREADQSVINPLLESELEKRFIQCLRNVKGFKLSPEIVKGKPGYHLRIDDTSWHLNLQQNLGREDGVEHQCRPDVIIEPIRKNVAKPIAIFLDGYAYHADETTGHNRIADDFLKRNAILKSGKWNVFSLTWGDLKGDKFAEGAFLEEGVGKIAKLLPKPLADAPIWKAANWNSWSLLSSYLKLQSKNPGEELPWHKVACFTAMTGAKSVQTEGGKLDKHFNTLVSGSKPNITNDPSGDVLTLYQECGPFRLLTATPMETIKDRSFGKSSAILWFNDQQEDEKQDFRYAWQQFLRATNILQFVPRFAASTKNMFKKGILGNAVEWVSQLQHEDVAKSPDATPSSTLSGEQLEELELVEESLATILVPPIKEGAIPYPIFGYENFLASGACGMSFVEVAWPDKKLAIALPNDETEEFSKKGWTLLDSKKLNREFLLKQFNSIP